MCASVRDKLHVFIHSYKVIDVFLTRNLILTKFSQTFSRSFSVTRLVRLPPFLRKKWTPRVPGTHFWPHSRRESAKD